MCSDNSWFPVSGTDLDNLQRKSHVVRQQLRLEDEDDTATLFGIARLEGDRFILALSTNPPAVFLDDSPMQYQIRIGDKVLNLIGAKDSPLRIEGGSLVRVDRASRELEVKVFRSGRLRISRAGAAMATRRRHHDLSWEKRPKSSRRAHVCCGG